MSSHKKLKEARRAARKEKRRMEAVPSSELEKELSDLMSALDKGIGKLRIPVRQGHAVGQALGQLARALDDALREHGAESREATAKKYLESVKTAPPEPALTPEQKAEARTAYEASEAAKEPPHQSPHPGGVGSTIVMVDPQFRENVLHQAAYEASEKARESEKLTLVPAEVDKIAADLTEAKAAETAGAA